ncbi:MAG: NADH-quinone oxidoreductase subunit M, partial [Mucilaginibacter polytrichastri]|nr:NADH-quinone oxidoreductase subunit M [Mucilaginibacter polytrichastri]
MNFDGFILIFLPLIGAIITAFIRSEKGARIFSLIWSLASLGHIALLTWLLHAYAGPTTNSAGSYPWIEQLGINFSTRIDGIGIIPILLTGLLIPLIIATTFQRNISRPNAFFALILFMQSGLQVVFSASDAFLFYVGWEMALIPIYFICSLWGDENRIRINLKFFIYTFAGSLVMLLAIIYLWLQTPDKSFSIESFYALNLDAATQGWIFWAFFLAFAIKMPVFPFHTWQPDTYTEAPTTGTMLLSGIMLKMGIYGVIRWLIPVVPLGFMTWGKLALILSVIGIVYASVIAFRQKDFKRLIAYSSIAHVGLISAGIFAWNVQGVQGAMIQMLNHGINVVGMFFVADIVINRLQTRELDKMGGIAKLAPSFAIGFLIVLLGSVALPLTNGFIGEFLLLYGLYEKNIWFAIVAGLTIIFGAVYMLRLYKQVM